MLFPPTSITLFVTSSSDSKMEVSLFAASYFQNSASKRACQSTRFFGLSFPMATSSEWKNPISGLVFCSCSSHDTPSIVYLASQLEKLVLASQKFQGDFERKTFLLLHSNEFACTVHTVIIQPYNYSPLDSTRKIKCSCLNS